MNEEHRRIYDEDREIPSWLRWSFISINRVGFPIVAFGCMVYMCQVSIAKVVEAVEQNTIVLQQVLLTIQNLRRG